MGTGFPLGGSTCPGIREATTTQPCEATELVQLKMVTALNFVLGEFYLNRNLFKNLNGHTNPLVGLIRM